MKLKIAILLLTIVSASELKSIYASQQEPVFIYLIDPSDKETIQAFEEDQAPTSETSTNAPLPVPIPAPKPKKSLDDLIDGLSKKPELTKSQARILKQVTAEQMEFIQLLENFVTADFDINDDMAKPEFNQIRERIVKLTFDAPSDRFFYDRLYLTNQSWLQNPNEVARFASLSKAMRDRSLELEERNRRFRQIIMGVAAAGGGVAGGFLSYKISQKVLPIVADQKGLATLSRMAGRTAMVFLGATVGAAAAAFTAFHGSGYFFQARDYINPINGDEDLNDILDVIATLPLN